MNITLKKLRVFLAMSEETRAFLADIYANGKKIGYAKNDGKGGCTNCQPYPETRAEFKAAEEHCLTLPATEWEFKGKTYATKSDLENVVNHLVDDEIQKKEQQKFKRKMQRDMQKGLIVGDETKYNLITWVGYRFEALLKNPKGRELVINKLRQLKANNQRVLNTNIPEEILDSI